MIRPLVDPAFVVVGGLVLLALVVLGLATSARRHRSGWVLRGLMVLLLCLIALQPGLGTASAGTRPSDLEVLVFVDRTTSMSALDWAADRPRLHGVRKDVTTLMEALPSARFTLVTFGRSVQVELPSTSDVNLVGETLSLMPREEPFAGRGSLVDRPLERMEALLTRLGEEQPDRRRIVVLMSDGENTAATQQRSFAPLAPLVDGGAVLGYGTTKGGLMPLDEDRPAKGWVIDSATGTAALSRYDAANLGKVAQELGVPYLHRTSPDGLAELTDGWQTFATDADDVDVRAELDLTWALALALVLCGVLDLRQHWRGLWQARRELA
jgi:Ca-activated chloride channel homolog